MVSVVQQAIAAWPTLMASGLRLGSPAVSVAQDGTRRDSWLGQFMQQVKCLVRPPVPLEYSTVRTCCNQTAFKP